MKPNGLVDAAIIASLVEKPKADEINENSFARAIFICLNVFSNSFAASATSGELTQ
jgi:hypothetical protein